MSYINTDTLTHTLAHTSNPTVNIINEICGPLFRCNMLKHYLKPRAISSFFLCLLYITKQSSLTKDRNIESTSFPFTYHC